MSDHNKKEIDELSGVETTGHEWDGLKELNNPLPRWWLWVFYACIAWSIWYFIVYPAWPIPGGNTKGTSGYTEYKELKESQKEIQARKQVYLDKFEKASFDEILNDPALYAFAIAGGKAAFKDNCATCHGTGAEGSKGFPNLNDDDWLWGGQIDTIHTTILHGIRAQDEDTRVSQMPAFGKDGLLKSDEINAVVDYVLSLSGGNKAEKPAEDIEKGKEIFAKQCSSCHGADAKGGRDVGAPNLTDGIWLYGGDHETVFNTVYGGRGGVMPAWKDRLDKNTIRELAVYIHELGGGEPTVHEETTPSPVINPENTPNKPASEPPAGGTAQETEHEQ